MLTNEIINIATQLVIFRTNYFNLENIGVVTGQDFNSFGRAGPKMLVGNFLEFIKEDNLKMKLLTFSNEFIAEHTQLYWIYVDRVQMGNNNYSPLENLAITISHEMIHLIQWDKMDYFMEENDQGKCVIHPPTHSSPLWYKGCKKMGLDRKGEKFASRNGIAYQVYMELVDEIKFRGL